MNKRINHPDIFVVQAKTSLKNGVSEDVEIVIDLVKIAIKDIMYLLDSDINKSDHLRKIISIGENIDINYLYNILVSNPDLDIDKNSNEFKLSELIMQRIRDYIAENYFLEEDIDLKLEGIKRVNPLECKDKLKQYSDNQGFTSDLSVYDIYKSDKWELDSKKELEKVYEIKYGVVVGKNIIEGDTIYTISDKLSDIVSKIDLEKLIIDGKIIVGKRQTIEIINKMEYILQ